MVYTCKVSALILEFFFFFFAYGVSNNKVCCLKKTMYPFYFLHTTNTHWLLLEPIDDRDLKEANGPYTSVDLSPALL